MPRDPVKFILTKQCPDATGMQRHKCWRDECDGPCKLEGLFKPISVGNEHTTAFHRDCQVTVDLNDPVKNGRYILSLTSKKKLLCVASFQVI